MWDGKPINQVTQAKSPFSQPEIKQREIKTLPFHPRRPEIQPVITGKLRLFRRHFSYQTRFVCFGLSTSPVFVFFSSSLSLSLYYKIITSLFMTLFSPFSTHLSPYLPLSGDIAGDRFYRRRYKFSSSPQVWIPSLSLSYVEKPQLWIWFC